MLTPTASRVDCLQLRVIGGGGTVVAQKAQSTQRHAPERQHYVLNCWRKTASSQTAPQVGSTLTTSLKYLSPSQPSFSAAPPGNLMGMIAQQQRDKRVLIQASIFFRPHGDQAQPSRVGALPGLLKYLLSPSCGVTFGCF